jgi:hypothetical protein
MTAAEFLPLTQVINCAMVITDDVVVVSCSQNLAKLNNFLNFCNFFGT